MTLRKKLIEVALPLEVINKETAREKFLHHGHPSTLHLWWSRKPLATCRAILFASLVDDPSSHPEAFPTVEAQEKERKRLFRIISDLVKWENSNNDRVVGEARQEILKSTGGNPPPVLDPFCGGGSIPLEAQRLGLTAHGSDLNPVAALITKALVEIPPRFAGRPPVNPEARERIGNQAEWWGSAGIAEDTRYYGRWMLEKAKRRIGQLYPDVFLPKEHGSGKAKVTAWLWARTIKCPNPACGIEMPLVSKFVLSSNSGRKIWVEPVIDKKANKAQFVVRQGEGAPPEGTINRRGAVCVRCGTPVSFDYIRAEGKAQRLGTRLLAMVADGKKRVYLSPSTEQEEIALRVEAKGGPETDLPEQALGFRIQRYGISRHRQLFTSRQLLALTTFSELVGEARELVRRDAVAAGLLDDELPLEKGGSGAAAYADAVATYLAFAVDKSADQWSTICGWNGGIRNTFARQAIPMTWDYAEANPFSEATGNFFGTVERIAQVVEGLPAGIPGEGKQCDAISIVETSTKPVISTDPPYYDNIGYADLSDFFYVWLRPMLGKIYPSLFATVLVPKARELVANPYRFGGDKDKARRFFEEGLREAFNHLREIANPEYPLTVYYAFKQSEIDEESGGSENDPTPTSTGWETMLGGLLKSGFTITGTWPLHTEMSARMRGHNSNVLATSIVLVCRPQPADAPVATLREFRSSLQQELSKALKDLQQGNIAPVDLAQAAIGPGMAVFSRYSKVLEPDGSPMPVRSALQLINQELDAYFAAQEGDLDPDTRFCVAWFEQFGMREAPFGEADILARAKNTAVSALAEAGMLVAARGKVRLFRREELEPHWSPVETRHRSIWLCTQHLVRAVQTGGEAEAARLARAMGSDLGDAAKSLAYHLYTISERRGWTEEALAYNNLVVSWPAIQEKTLELSAAFPVQSQLIF
ncbi:MAG: DUF1156 domain-containing protein [Bacillota bacterium]